MINPDICNIKVHTMMNLSLNAKDAGMSWL